MLIVLDPAGAEGDLRASEICCPSCTSGRLRGSSNLTGHAVPAW